MKKTNQGFIVPLVIIVVVLAIAGGLYIYSKNQVSETKTDSKVEKTLTVEQSNVYTNSTHGFSLTFPNTWTGYRALETSDEQGSRINFGVKDQDIVFSISVLTKAEYADYLKGGLQPMRMIGQNDSFVFLGGSAQDSTLAVEPLLPDVAGILATFKLVK